MKIKIGVADSLFEARNYEAARLAYRKTLTYKVNEDYVLERIDRINSIIIPDTASTYSATTNDIKPEDTKTGSLNRLRRELFIQMRRRKVYMGLFHPASQGRIVLLILRMIR